MNVMQEPPGWGKDSLSEFIKISHENSFRIFVNKKQDFELLLQVDNTFRFLIEHLNETNQEKLLVPLLFLKSSYSFLGAARLSISCQVTESYMVQRGCLENALYGLYFNNNPESQKIWLDRHADDESLKKVKNEFRIGSIFYLLQDLSPDIYKYAKELYDETINFGGHPNANALLSTLKITETVNPNKTITTNYEPACLTNNPVVVWACIETNIEIGICVLDIFGLIFSKRYEIMDIQEKIQRLKSDLAELRTRKKRESDAQK